MTGLTLMTTALASRLPLRSRAVTFAAAQEPLNG